MDEIQKMIEAEGMTAPRVTPADIEAEIAGEHYFTAEQGSRRSCMSGCRALRACPRFSQP